MQEQLKDQVLEKLINYLQNTEDFILEQVPETIYQVLRYEKTAYYISAFLMLTLLIIGLYIGYHFWKHPTLDKYGSREIGSFMGTLIQGLLIKNT
jgi:hypothetical protein